MGYVFTSRDAEQYENWFNQEPGRTAFDIEKEILYRVWFPLSAQRVLEIGCGTGHFLEWLADQGHQVTGLEPSSPMLRFARRRVPQKVHLHHGYAEELPYEDNAFDTVVIITTLEFVEDPVNALKEAFRVARNHVLLGVFNRYSLIGVQRSLECLWKSSVYRHARFFSVFGLWHLVEKILDGRVPIRWRTCLNLPLWSLRYLHFLEGSRYLQWQPFGHFIAMRIDLRYRLQTIQQPLLHTPSSHVKHATQIHRALHSSEECGYRYGPAEDGGHFILDNTPYDKDIHCCNNALVSPRHILD